VNHCVIMNNKKEREKVRLKKCNDIKYQTNLAKIRIDSMLKERLESINNRLLEEKLSFRKHSMLQKSRLGQIHKMWTWPTCIWRTVATSRRMPSKPIVSCFQMARYWKSGLYPRNPGSPPLALAIARWTLVMRVKARWVARAAEAKRQRAP
jgi:hypothetical protein